ncbi:MAG: isoleucine--tRNA ligase [Bacteroidaceae bacterium]|nr:isoleucine--tRNA ligase [Bacteroidaceae bacterium]
MTKKFAEHKGLNLSEVNKSVLNSWDEKDLFHKSMSEREGCPSFVFFEGPPSANGMPGIHHVMARSIKDTFCRYKTMQGFQVKRKAGWDTHGLPVELGVEKALGITKEDIGKKISVDEYNAACRKEVMKYTKEWTDLTHKMGYWVDLENPYITYENSYIETLWWLLKQLYGKGLLYKGYTIQPYSPAAGTGLSSHELNQPGCYRDVKDTTVTGLFKMVGCQDAALTEWGTPCFVAWTTTPWTLPSNVALCVGPNIDYVAAQTFNPYNGDKVTVILAEARLKAYLSGQEYTSLTEMEALDLDKVDGKNLPYRIVGHFKGSDLVGMKYQQLMQWVKPVEKVDDLAAPFVQEYVAAHPEKQFSMGNDTFIEMSEQAFRVIPGDYVTTEDGTGIVHIAPTFGADDAKVAKDAGIPHLFMINKAGETRPMVDLQGKYYTLEDCAEEFVNKCVNKEGYSKHAGDFVKNAYDPRFNEGGKYDQKTAEKTEDLNVTICLEMKQEGTAFKIEKHVHNYPHCWRTDKPVLYYPLDSWFIKSTACKDRMVELNQTIQWKPESTGTGRFGMWLKNLNDWNLSRSRYWGTPLPIWRNAETREEICIGSIQELWDEIEKSVAAGIMSSNPYKDKGFVPGDYSKANYDKIDLHRPYVDDIVLVSESGKPMKRETDLIDVWFDSGAMPYAQVHYPFENKEILDNREVYPANFIAEGVDQTRGWFFTLHALATMIFDSVAYKAVISNGLVLDKNGSKMSKRLGNAVDPFGAIEKYGSDPLRWYMITNSAPWDNLKFDEEGVKETSGKFFGTLYNTYSLFAMYANVNGFTGEEEEIPVSERELSDRWVISALNSLVSDVTEAFNDYEPTRAGRAIQDFVSDRLSNWYVRLNRSRFWNGDVAANQTLYSCLDVVSRLMAPIAPFFADQLYLDLHEGETSVHLAKFPVAEMSLVNKDLETVMDYAMNITSIVLALRKKVNIKVRQPLQKVILPIMDKKIREGIISLQDIIKNETNIKEIDFVDDSSEMPVVKKAKCNFRVMGKKFGKQMKAVAALVEAVGTEDINAFEKSGQMQLTLDGQAITIEPEDVSILCEDIPGWQVANEGIFTVALDIQISEELRKEGMARELVNRLQNLRKSSGLEITDRIKVVMAHCDQLDEAVASFKEYICGQVLATELAITDNVADSVELEFDDFKLPVNITKA